MAIVLSLKVGSYDWTRRTSWHDFKATVRQGVGAAASFTLDTTGIVDAAPTCSDRFTLTLPTGEKIVLVPTGDPSTLYRTDGSEIITTHTYDTIDVVTALDRVPLPALQFIESTAGEIITTLVGLLDPTIDVSGVADGNDVPYLDTSDFVKFSEVVQHQSIETGGYTVQFDPTTNGGLAIEADYKTNFGDSGISVDKNSYDFSPHKEIIEPDNNIVNYQRVRSTNPAPHHTVMEFRELDALVASFKLKTLPYGLENSELLNFQFEDGDISGADQDDLPNIIPLHYPVQVEIPDITLGGAGELCAFVGRNNTTVLSLLVGASSIGANVGGSSFTESTPFAPNGAAPSLNHQYYYDFFAKWSASGLTVQVVENYLNNEAASTVLATVSGINQSAGTVTVSLVGVATIGEIPPSIRIFPSGDPDNIRGFTTITERSGSTLTIDNWPEGLAVGDVISYPDSAATLITERTLYNGAAPSNRYGQPRFVVSGGAGVTARQWTVSYGPAIQATLLPNPYTGAPGRPLRVDTVGSRSSDMVISASGNTAVCTFVGERLPLRGSIRLLLNYDAAEIIDVVVQDTAAQARCGIRQGEIIESDAVLSVAEATALAQAVLDDFADPLPTGSINRESILTPSFPMPNQLVSIDLPPEYKIGASSVPISDISIDFGGYDSEADEGVLLYKISLGNVSSVDAIQRQLLTNQTSAGLAFRPLSAPGSRITSGTWNDEDLVTIGVTGSVALNGRPAGTSFDPADYSTGGCFCLRGRPVRIAGTVTSGGVVSELLVEVIYPPVDIDTASSTCSYSPKTNLITYRWGRPAGAISYQIKRKLDDGTGTGTLVFKLVDEIFTESYPLPYEPLSKAIMVQTIGLADKLNPAGYQLIECTLATMPAPTPFTLAAVPKPVKPNGRIVFLVGAPPSGAFAGRAEYLKILMTTTPTVTPPTAREHFDDADPHLEIETLPVQGITTGKAYKAYYDDWDPGEDIYATAVWVDRFGDESLAAVPFNVTNPPVTVGFIDPADFFQSATQALGGTYEDDDEQSSKIEFSGKFRVHLGNNNGGVKIWFEQSQPYTGMPGALVWNPDPFTSHLWDVTDDDILNGYTDVPVIQRFRDSKKKHRMYRPAAVTFIGPLIREVIDGAGNKQSTQEKRHLRGYTGSPPPIVDHETDGVFDTSLFHFSPSNAVKANNFITVMGVKLRAQAKGLKVSWNGIDDPGLLRVVILVSTTNFGTRGPGTDTNIATDLNTLFSTGEGGNGTILLYDPTNTTRNVSVQALDVQKQVHDRLYNGDTIGTITITAGVTYFVSVLAQNKAGRWSSALATVVSNIPGTSDTIAPPTAPGTPVLGDIVENVSDPTASGGTALVTFLVWADSTHTKAFNDATINAVDANVILRTGDTEDKVVFGGPISNLAATSQRIQAILELGRTYTWRYAVLTNGGGNTKSAPATISFIAGMPSATLPSVVVSVAPINFGVSSVTVTVTQPSTARPIKKIVLFQNGVKVDSIHVVGDSTFNANSAIGTHTFRPGHPGDVLQSFFCRAVMGNNVNVDSNTVNITPGQDPPSDTGAPPQPLAPIVKEYFGDITLKAKLPTGTAGSRVILDWQLAIRDQNIAPSTSDPPTQIGGGTVFDFMQDAGGIGKWRIPGTTQPRWFFARCRNANNPTLWSAWSPSSVINSTLNPIDSWIGTGPPTLAVTTDPFAARGYATVSAVQAGTPIFPTTKEPMRVWQDDNGDNVIEVIVPTDANAYSLTHVQFEVYRVNGNLKFTQPVDPTSPVTFRVHGDYRKAIRYRLRNRYRAAVISTDGDRGWSAWTNYVEALASSSATFNYDPISNIPPPDDPGGILSRPIKYPSF